MRVDVAHSKHFIIASAVATLIIIIALIVGGTAPKEFDSKTLYAYDCNGNSHVWNADTCDGVQLSDNSTEWYVEISDLTALNRFWSFQFSIFSQLNVSVQNYQLDVRVQVMASDNQNGPWTMQYLQDTTQDISFCDAGSLCESLVLVDEQNLKYSYYLLSVRILNGYEYPGFIGDVRGIIWTGHAGYSSLELGLRIVFLAVTSSLLVALLWWLRSLPLDEWSWEQRAIVILLLALVAYNNPFYGLQYAARGWFFKFLNALFNVLFLSSFLIFSLLVLDKIRLEDVKMEVGKQHIIKYGVVGIFAILGIILFAWVDIRDDIDPILGHPKAIAGVGVLFYFVAAFYSGILLWICVLVVMTVPVATSKRYIQTRFLFIAIPTGYCVVSVLIGIFAGTFGPVYRNTMAMVYFLTVFNLYVWILTAGFWPIKERFLVRNPSEADSIIHFGRAAEVEEEN